MGEANIIIPLIYKPIQNSYQWGDTTKIISIKAKFKFKYYLVLHWASYYTHEYNFILIYGLCQRSKLTLENLTLLIIAGAVNTAPLNSCGLSITLNAAIAPPYMYAYITHVQYIHYNTPLPLILL